MLNRISKDRYYMNIAREAAARSTCFRARHGAVIVKDDQIISTGYVGAPRNTKDSLERGFCLRHKLGIPSGHRYELCRSVHAEQNAIINAARAGVSLIGSKMYLYSEKLNDQGKTKIINSYPCFICKKMIVNAGILEIISHQEDNSIKYYHVNDWIRDWQEKDLIDDTEQYGVANKKNEEKIKQYERGLADIFIYDEFNPEDNAMLQALYSRSSESVETHVEKVKTTGSGKFMEKFYIGYGHLSIADCGSTTIFIENISILADKAIQDWPLYSGQETSTRYVDMSRQPIIDPIKTSASKSIIDNWMNFYIESQDRLKEYLKNKYPKKENEEDNIYNKAIVARAFDIMRGFLPAGITTQLSWHTNLRQAWDKLALIRHHPLFEIREISEKILEKLRAKYPHSFSHKIYSEQEKYREEIMAKYNFYAPIKCPKFNIKTNIKNEELNEYYDIISQRPIKTNLPHFLSGLGNIVFDFILDYGSFRDIQRHRNGVCYMPLLTTNFGFNEWYLNQLPDDLKMTAFKLIGDQKIAIANLNAPPEIQQYYIPLGFNVPCKIAYGLPAAVYVLELRSMKTVHPTLRQIAHQMHFAIKDMFPNVKLHSDLEPDDWDIRRGLQDIVAKT